MHLKLLRAAAAVAVLGGTATLGIGTQAAMATTTVSCSTPALVTAMTGANGVTLSLSPHCTYWVSAALPSVMHTVTIDGNGATIVRNTDTPFSIFVVGCAAGDLTLNNVNVKNGGGSGYDGGAVDVANSGATLNINGGTFSDNSAVYNEATGGYGGAIYNLGTMTVDGATFTGNSANWGGAIDSDNGGETATLNDDSFTYNNANEGGAIYNLDNNLQIGEGNFRNNSATGEDGEGGAIYNADAMRVIAATGGDTLFEMNSASYEGGAIYNADQTVNLNNSLVELNRAYDGGGGIFNDGGVVTLSLDQILLNKPNNCDPTNTIDGCTG